MGFAQVVQAAIGEPDGENYRVKGPAHAFAYGEQVHFTELKHHAEEHLKELRQHHPEQTYVQIGFAGFFNLELAAQSRPDALVLCDINSSQKAFWKEMLRRLIAAPTPQDFIRSWNTNLSTVRSCLYTLPESDGKAHEKPSSIALRFDGQDIRMQPWLQHEEQYAYLRQLALDNNIAVVDLDILDTERCRRLAQAVHDAGHTVALLYASNIGSFLYSGAAMPTPSGRLTTLKTDFYGKPKNEATGKLFQENLNLLADDATLTFDVGTDKRWRLIIVGKNPCASNSR